MLKWFNYSVKKRRVNIILFLSILVILSACIPLVLETKANYYTPILDSSENVDNPENALVNDDQWAIFTSASSNSWIIFDCGLNSSRSISRIEMRYYSVISNGRVSIYVSRNKSVWYQICKNSYDGLSGVSHAFTLSYELRDIRYIKVKPYNYFEVDYIFYFDNPYVFESEGYVYAKYMTELSNTVNSRWGSLGVGIGKKTSDLTEWFDLAQGDYIIYQYDDLVNCSAFGIVTGSGSGSDLITLYVSNSSNSGWIDAGDIQASGEPTGESLAYEGFFRYVKLTIEQAGSWAVYSFNVTGLYYEPPPPPIQEGFFTATFMKLCFFVGGFGFFFIPLGVMFSKGRKKELSVKDALTLLMICVLGFSLLLSTGT